MTEQTEDEQLKIIAEKALQSLVGFTIYDNKIVLVNSSGKDIVQCSAP